MPYSLKNRNVLVTGGSKGLGAVIAAKFAAEGSNIAINYANDTAAAQSLKAELEKEHGVKAVVVKADAGSMAECKRCVEETIQALGGIDVIIGNAVSGAELVVGKLGGVKADLILGE